MKLQLIASAAAACLLTAAPALADTSGYVGVDWSRTTLHTAFGNGSYNSWTGEAAVAGQFEQSDMGYQLDTAYESTNHGFSDNWDATVHAYKRNSDMAVGVFAGGASVGGSGAWDAGLEAQKYLGQSTLSGQLAYGHLDGAGGTNAWAIKGDYAFYAMDNLRLDGSLGYTSANTSPRASFLDAGVRAEYKVDKTPFSVFASYDYSKAHNVLFLSHVDTIRLGVRLNFGAPTLKARDRNGAGMSRGIDAFSSAIRVF